jgi:hypothetical protein
MRVALPEKGHGALTDNDDRVTTCNNSGTMVIR